MLSRILFQKGSISNLTKETKNIAKYDLMMVYVWLRVGVTKEQFHAP